MLVLLVWKKERGRKNQLVLRTNYKKKKKKKNKKTKLRVDQKTNKIKKKKTSEI